MGKNILKKHTKTPTLSVPPTPTPLPIKVGNTLSYEGIESLLITRIREFKGKEAV